MEIRPDQARATTQLRRSGSEIGAEDDGASRLAPLLLGAPVEVGDLPSLADLATAIVSIADGTRRKIVLPVAISPVELAIVRRGDSALVSHYSTLAVPDVRVLDRPVPVRQLLDACERAVFDAIASAKPADVRGVLECLLERVRDATVVSAQGIESRTVERTGGAIEQPAADVPLAFGFQATLAACVDPLPESSSRADVHATLFDGVLWAWIRGKRVVVARGPVLLAVHRMVAAVRALVDAWRESRGVNVRLRSGAFLVGVRRERDGAVALTLGAGDDGTITVPALDVAATALPILRVASDLLRAVVAVDRSQARNLRISSLRDEVRELRRAVRARAEDAGFENEDPERLRLSAPPAAPGAGADDAAPSDERLAPSAGRLRFAERWHREMEGLDAGSTFLCGDRILVATPRRMTALDRDGGDVAWSEAATRAISVMAGTTLLRLSATGNVELWDVSEGGIYATARVAPRMAGAACGTWAGGGSAPPVAVIAEGSNRLVAIDLRTGEPRWRFTSRGGSAFRFRRAGRLLLVVTGDSALHAIDVASGEEAWRLAARTKLTMAPAVCHDVVVAAAGEPGDSGGALYGIGLYSGRTLWRRDLDAPPTAVPIGSSHANGPALIALGGDASATLAAVRPSDGSFAWTIADPGIGRGAAAMTVDGALVVNAPGGRVCAIDLADGHWRWSTSLANPVADDVPRRLEPVLRGGALFVPAATVHVLRPSDGAPLGSPLECDTVPDLLRVDERGWLYVAEDGGHIRALGPAPQLRLVR